MYRVYLDWNVITSLYQNRETTKELEKVLFNSDYDIMIPYSLSHIQDVMKTSSVSKVVCENELEYLDKITKKNYIDFDKEKNTTRPYIAKAREVYESNNECLNVHNLSIDTIIDLISKNTHESVGRLAKLLLKLLPSPKLPEDTYINNNMPRAYLESIQKIQQSQSLYQFLENIWDSNINIWRSSNQYSGYRFETQNYFGLKPVVLSSNDNPVEKIDDAMQALDTAGAYKGVDDFFNTQSNNSITSSMQMKYTMYYLLLDMCGYHSDKMTPKNSPSNLLTDAMHSFYGAHCDYFITLDKKMTSKSLALYKKFNCDTKVLDPCKFVEELTEHITKYDSIEDLILEVIENSNNNDYFVKEISDNIEDDSRVFLFKPLKKIFNYFNFQYLFAYNDGRRTFRLRRVSKNMSRFITYTEVAMIVNRFHDLLGNDLNKRDSYSHVIDDGDLSNIQRYWLHPMFYITLSYDRLETSIQLDFELINEQFVSYVEDELDRYKQKLDSKVIQ